MEKKSCVKNLRLRYACRHQGLVMGWLRNRNLICFVIWTLISSASAFAQFGGNAVSVSGMVLVEGSNQRVEHATVRLCDTGNNLIEQTITSDSGEFSFSGVQRSRYILTFEANGLLSTDLHLDLSFASDKGITIYMKPRMAESKAISSGPTVSAHELSMPEGARELVASGREKLYVKKDAKGGLADFQRATAKAPGYYEAHREIAMAYLMMGKVEEAKENLRKAIEVSHDTYGEADVGLGTLLAEHGEVEAGEQFVRRGVQLDPTSWMGFYELGKLELDGNRLEEARGSAERARSLAPNAPIVYRLLANIDIREKNYAGVLKDIDEYLKLDPSSAAGMRAKEMRSEIQRELERQRSSGDTNPR